MGIENSINIFSDQSPGDAFLKLVGCLWSANESIRVQAAFALSTQAERLDCEARAQAVRVLKDSLSNGILKRERRAVRAAVSAIKTAPESDLKVTLTSRAQAAVRCSRHVDSLNEETRARAVEVLKRALAEGVLEPFDLWQALKRLGVRPFNDAQIAPSPWFAGLAKLLMRTPAFTLNPLTSPAVPARSMLFANLAPASAWPASAQWQIARQQQRAQARI
ncbi:hypothetical protein HY992_01925 [Candidatus Micrarchaeota archaeon]|nr:hypothetical protein [Candidatus Micrarchaeota archaeon]